MSRLMQGSLLPVQLGVLCKPDAVPSAASPRDAVLWRTGLQPLLQESLPELAFQALQLQRRPSLALQLEALAAPLAA
jgi:hypothetical protein